MDPHTQKSPLFQLVFQGPKDSRPETLRELRGALLCEMALDAEQAKFFLENAPITMEESDEESSLLPKLKTLQDAGADALIVRSKKMLGSHPKKLSTLKSSPLQLVKRDAHVPTEELPLHIDFDDFLSPSKPSIPCDREEQEPSTDELQPLLAHLQKNALLDDEFRPTMTPLRDVRGISGESPTESPWIQYRSWIEGTDKQFRTLLNQDMVVGTLLSCIITILVCSILIPLELHTRELQWSHERRVDGLLNTYADIVLYGRLPNTKGKK